MRVDRLTSFEGETLIRFLLNHMGSEIRGKLMVEFPVIYRKLLGRDADSEFNKAIRQIVIQRPLPIDVVGTKEQKEHYYSERPYLKREESVGEVGDVTLTLSLECEERE